jgi:7-cyano-7-deazaguanine synthase
MDSVAALYQAARDHQITSVLSFHYGSKHNDREIPFAEWHARRLDVPHSSENLECRIIDGLQ